MIMNKTFPLLTFCSKVQITIKKYCPTLAFSYSRKVSISPSKFFTFSLSPANNKPLFLTLP